MAEVHKITRTALEELLVGGNLRPYATLDELDEFELRDDLRWLVVAGSVWFPDFHGCTYPDVRVYCCSNSEEFAAWLAENDAAWYLAHPEMRIREFEVWHVVDDPLHDVKIRKSAYGDVVILTSKTQLLEDIWDRYNGDWSLFAGYSTVYGCDYLVLPNWLWDECGQTVEGLLA